MNEVLYNAVLSEQMSIVLGALRVGANPFHVQRNGDTAYAAASRRSSTCTLHAIITSLASLIRTGGNGVLPFIHDICRQNDAKGLLVLLDHAPLAVHQPDAHCATPLHVAAELGLIDVVDVLLKNGARVNQPRGCDGKPAISIAVIQNRTAVVRLLLRYGADWRQADNMTKDALTHACVFDRSECIRLFLSNADVDCPHPVGRTPLHVDYPVGRTPLHWALDHASMAAVETLLCVCSPASLGKMMRTADFVNRTPFHLIFASGSITVVACAMQACARAGINFNAPFCHVTDDKYPLEICIEACRKHPDEYKRRCLQLIVQYHSIDTNRTMSCGRTPLELAALTDNLAVFEVLLLHPDTWLWHLHTSLLHTVIYNGKCNALRLLLAEIVRRGQHTPGSERIDTLSHPQLITPLRLAIEINATEMAVLLLRTPLDFNIDMCESVNSDTALHVACRKNMTDVAVALLERGANVFAVDYLGMRPLLNNLPGCRSLVTVCVAKQAKQRILVMIIIGRKTETKRRQLNLFRSILLPLPIELWELIFSDFI